MFLRIRSFLMSKWSCPEKIIHEKSPKHGLATLLRLIGVQGKEFENKMQLGHDAANKVRKDADGILEKGLKNFNATEFRANKRTPFPESSSLCLIQFLII